MSSQRSATPLFVELKSSVTLFKFFVLIHGLASAALPLIELPFVVSIAIACAVVISLTQNLLKHAWRVNPKSVIAMGCDSHQQWYFVCNNRIRIDVQLKGSTTLLPNVIVINIKQESYRFSWLTDGRYSVIVTRDAMDDNYFRQLKVRLRTFSKSKLKVLPF